MVLSARLVVLTGAKKSPFLVRVNREIRALCPTRQCLITYRLSPLLCLLYLVATLLTLPWHPGVLLPGFSSAVLTSRRGDLLPVL